MGPKSQSDFADPMTYRPVTLADLARDGKPGREDRPHQRPQSRFFDEEGLKVMATTKLLFDTFHYTVTRRNDGSIEIAPKGDPKATRIFHKRAKRVAIRRFRDLDLSESDWLCPPPCNCG
jgi:hypothetical protein